MVGLASHKLSGAETRLTESDTDCIVSGLAKNFSRGQIMIHRLMKF